MHEESYLTDELLEQTLRSRALEPLLPPETDDEMDLAAFLAKMLDKHGLRKSEVIRRTNLNETHIYQVFSGSRGVSRNKALALALAMGLDLHDTRLLLVYADVGDLYVKNRRDQIITFCISHGYDLARTDEELYRFDEPTISDGD